MTKEFVRDGKLDREAAAEALRDFLQGIARAGQFEFSVKVRTAVSFERHGRGRSGDLCRSGRQGQGDPHGAQRRSFEGAGTPGVSRARSRAGFP